MLRRGMQITPLPQREIESDFQQNTSSIRQNDFAFFSRFAV